MLRIGLTGGIASGKTTVADLFVEFGATVIDTDRIARDVVAPGRPALKALIKALGPEFIVWDKAAAIRFRRPGRATLHATFRLSPETVEAVRAETRRLGKLERDFEIALVDAAGEVHALCTKTVHVRCR